MSVTVVSPPKPPAVAAPETTTSTTAAAGPDFATLLFAQLAPQVAPQTAALEPDVLPAASGQENTRDLDPAASDAASLLAALGMVAAQPASAVREISATPGSARAASAPDATGKVDAPERALFLPLTDKAPAAAASTSTFEPHAEVATTEANVPPVAAGADKPAKVAVGAPVVELAMVKSAALDAAPNSAPALAAHPHNVPAQRDAPLTVATPVRDQNWSSDFAQKIVWLATNDRQTAQMTLNPPQMGPIEISVNIEKGSATASFVSASAEVRDAIETALPRLREMFASAGINLGQANVSAESFKQQAGGDDGNRGTSRWRSDNVILVEDSTVLPGRGLAGPQGIGMVDIFA